jgi:predicted RNA-binding Zn ribbon-like protein
VASVRVGGHPVLDFLNTVSDFSAAAPRDELAGFPAARARAVALGLCTRREARLLADPRGKELKQLRATRDLLHGVFAHAVPQAGELRALDEAWAGAARHARLRPAEGVRLAVTFDVQGSGAALIRHRLVQQAVELLTSPLRERIGACPACGWTFVDTSKNRSRRWCSMKMCGGVAKARAYYRRQKRR